MCINIVFRLLLECGSWNKIYGFVSLIIFYVLLDLLAEFFKRAISKYDYSYQWGRKVAVLAGLVALIIVCPIDPDHNHTAFGAPEIGWRVGPVFWRASQAALPKKRFGHHHGWPRISDGRTWRHHHRVWRLWSVLSCAPLCATYSTKFGSQKTKVSRKYLAAPPPIFFEKQL